MDVDIEKRLETLERIIQEDARITKYERMSFRVGGGLIFGILTLLVLILAKSNEVVHYAALLWHSLFG
jgi:hypothetical protein